MRKDEITVHRMKTEIDLEDACGNIFAIELESVPRVVADILNLLTVEEIRLTLTLLAPHLSLLSDLGNVAPIDLRHTLHCPDVNADTLSGWGKEWIRGDKHRIYFDHLQGWYGLFIERGPRGAVCGIRFRGEPISELLATRYIRRFSNTRIWFDVLDECFYGQGLWQEDFEFIVAQILSTHNLKGVGSDDSERS